MQFGQVCIEQELGQPEASTKTLGVLHMDILSIQAVVEGTHRPDVIELPVQDAHGPRHRI